MTIPEHSHARPRPVAEREGRELMRREQAYRDFSQTTDEEVRDLLRAAPRSGPAAVSARAGGKAKCRRPIRSRYDAWLHRAVPFAGARL
jgi:hypothetical protein